MTPLSNEAEILKAVQALEDKLTGVINAGLQGVNMAIAALSDQHHKALLDQERRNGLFAERQRVEDVARNVHELSNQLTGYLFRLSEVEKSTDRLDGRLLEVAEVTSSRSFSLLSGISGYLVMLILMLCSNLLTFLLAHAVH